MTGKAFSFFFVTFFVSTFMGMPLFLSLIVIWKGLFGNLFESIVWGFVVGLSLGTYMWPFGLWWVLMISATSTLLYLTRRYLILKLTPVTITLLTCFSLLVWHSVAAIFTHAHYAILSPFPSFFVNAFIASITIILYHAIFCPKKGPHQPRLWKHSSRRVIHPSR